MIISYSKNFIFFKVQKTGSSSVEENLSHVCSSEDIVTPDIHRKPGKNYKQGNITIYNHMRPDKLLDTEFMTIDEFRSFKRIAVCRNPWDKMVSAFWWIKVVVQNAYAGLYGKDLWSKALTDFGPFVKGYLIDGMNARDSEAFYFDKDGCIQMTDIIFYESLQVDYESVCRRLDLRFEQLPVLKSQSRLFEDLYNVYYTPDIRDLVAEEFKLEIETFGYTF